MSCGPPYCRLVLAGPPVLLGTAIYARHHHASISAKRATVDFMVSQEANLPPTAARRVFGQSGSKGFQHLKALPDAVGAGSASDEQWSEYASINMYLNHCELVAVAIDSGALDEELYNKANQSLCVQAWDRSKEYIQHPPAAKSQPTMFEHFEIPAKRWTG